MIIVNGPQHLDWVPVPEVGAEIAAIAYSRPYPHKDSISIAEAAAIAKDYRLRLIPSRIARELFVRYPERGQETYQALKHGGNVHTWLTGTVVVGARMTRKKGSFVIERHLEDRIPCLGLRELHDDATSLRTHASYSSLHFSVPKRIGADIGIVDFQDCRFEDEGDGIHLVVERQSQSMRLVSRARIREEEELRHVNGLRLAIEYPSDPRFRKEFLRAPLLGAITSMHGPFGEAYTTFVEATAGGALVYRPLEAETYTPADESRYAHSLARVRGFIARFFPLRRD